MAQVLLVVKKSAFLSSLPAGFSQRPGSFQVQCHDGSVNILTDDKNFAGQSAAREVNSADDVQQFKSELNGKWLLTMAHCTMGYTEHEYHTDTDGTEGSRLGTLQEDYVVIVNTNHPEVKKGLDKFFERAATLITENKNFTLKFDLDNSVGLFYGSVPHARSKPETAGSINASIFITHNAQPIGFWGRCLGCNSPQNKMLWCICLPCCLFTGVPYFCYRKCIKSIVDEKVDTRFHTYESPQAITPGIPLASLFGGGQVIISTAPTPLMYGQQQAVQPVAYQPGYNMPQQQGYYPQQHQQGGYYPQHQQGGYYPQQNIPMQQRY